MLAKYERRAYKGGALVWAGRYRNLHNLSHWHFECELIACQSGSATVMIDNNRYQICAGMCAFCPSESVHFIESVSSSVLVVALFDKSLTRGATDLYDLVNPIFSDSYNVCENLFKIRDECKKNLPFYGELSNAAITNTVFSIFRGEQIEKKASKEISVSNENYKKLLLEIDRSEAEITFEEAATLMNMSPPYFSRYFKNIAGMTFSRYLNSIRVEKAVDLLVENPKISSSSLMLKSGFSTLRNFNRVFKDITGFSPRELPDNFVPTIRTSLEKEGKSFDPTLNNSELF